MLKRFIILSITLFMVFGIIACNKTKDRTLQVGVSADYPPFEFYKNGEIIGIDIDIIKEIAKELGYEIQLHDIPFEHLISSLESGKIDLAISGITATAERAGKVEFSKSYSSSNIAMLFLADESYTSIQDLKGLTVGVQTGSIMENYLKPLASKLEILISSISDNKILIEQLKVSRIQAVIVEQDQAIAWVALNPKLKYIKLETVEEGYSIALKKGNKMVSEINNVIKKMQENNKIKDIHMKWQEKPN